MIPKSIYVYLTIWMMLVGCEQTNAVPTPALCNGYPQKTVSQPNCIAVNAGTLIQTALNQQSQVFIGDIELTIQGTIYINPSNNHFTVSVLEGTTLIGTPNIITTVGETRQVTITDNRVISKISAYDVDVITALPLNQLQRSINIVAPTPTIEAIATLKPDCPHPENWTGEYQVKSGDTLTTIAQAVDESLIDLQTANCIDNPNNLRVGQILDVPHGAILATQPAETFTPSAVFFRADSESINSNDCTVLRWDIQNVHEVKLDEKIVSGQTSQEVCPTTSITYTLIINYFDDTQSQHHVTITVNEP
jgi:hypothetical protein